MTYLLDTCAVSDFLHGHPRVLAKIKQVSPGDLCVSSISLMEVHYGLALSPSAAARLRRLVDTFFSKLDILPFDDSMASIAARIRAGLRRKGRPIGAYDVLIAATALDQGLVLVTSNVREFARVDDLVVEDWRSPS